MHELSGAFDAIILCGGRGTRIASVISDIPKPLAPVLGRPFLDHLIDYLATSRVVASVTLAVGHLSGKIIEHFELHPAPLPIRFAVETKALGTGGALLNALPSTTTDTLLCLNGDSFFGANLAVLLLAHKRQSLDATLALVHVDDTSRFGRVTIDDVGRVLSFSEKGTASGPGLINAGVYVIARAALERLEKGPSSLEHDIFPRLAAQRRLSGVVLDGPFIDIGLPETYASAAAFIEALERDPRREQSAHPSETKS